MKMLQALAECPSPTPQRHTQRAIPAVINLVIGIFPKFHRLPAGLFSWERRKKGNKSQPYQYPASGRNLLHNTHAVWVAKHDTRVDA